ncbi:transglycosylase domain-containing protein [Acidaminococcus timonensis]|jgi:penicillin-binding protein 1A|uniref:transglycosylase domain-containing protein n=1 Tax=Acidaminococcus TaxID=904 RepID=UPI0025EBA1FF|nr:penicillin-binding protein 1A [Acidaminococcus timonensis]
MTSNKNKNWRNVFGSPSPHKHKKLGGTIFSAVLALILVGFLSVAAFFALAKFTTAKILTKDMAPMASSQFFDAKGNLITTVDSEEDRIPVTIDKTPKNLQHAFLAAEDIRFYEHGGIDFRGIGRAIYTYIRWGEVQGGSTITQQLAKNYFLTQEQTLSRKLHEAFIALQIEQKYTKNEILEMYMNQIYFGQGAYGVETAANTYFGKHVQDLDLAQCAMIAGIPKSPNYYSPLSNPKAAKERQKTVLEQMAKYGFITKEQADEAYAEPLTYKSLNESPGSKKYFIDYVIQLLVDKFGPDAVYKQGLKVYTTLDPDMQKAAETAAARTPTYYTDSNKLKQPQSSIVAVDPKTGYIKAMIGGRGTDQFNRAVMAERQPGSAFKPFVYMNAFEQGATPSDTVQDSPIPGDWNPQNYDRSFHGTVTYRTALTYSYNVPAVKVAMKYGPEKIVKLAKKFGITTLVDDDENAVIALGGLTHGVTPLEMAGAYAGIANMGKFNKPTPIIKILDRNGKVLYEHKSNPTQVVKPETAYMMISMMEDVMTRGTGRGAAINRPCAGKSGTTSDYHDAWFVGFTPDLACAVWIGDDNNDSLGGMTGGGEPATLWRTFMSNALANTPASDFDAPEGFKMPAPKYEAPKKSSSSSSSSKKAADTKKSSSKSKDDALPGDGNVPQPPRSSGKSSTPPPVRPPKQ